MSSYNRSTRDIKLGVLKKCGEMIDGSSQYERNGTILDYIQKANLRVLAGGNEFVRELSKPWPWALEPNPVVITLLPAITNVAATVTAQGTAVTLSVAPKDWNSQNVSVAGWWIQLNGYPEWFKISAHIAGQTTATLDSAWSDASAGPVSATIVKLEYDLQDPAGNGIMRLAQQMKVYRNQNLLGDQEFGVYYADEGPMLKEFPMALLNQNVPTRFAIVQKTQSKVTVRFNSYPSSPTRVEVRYVKYPDPLTDTPGRPFNATVTIANPGVFTGPQADVESGYPGFNLVNDDTFTLSTTGALPTGLTAGTTYYVVNASGAKFQASATKGGAPIVTSGTQSGVHTVTPSQPASYPLIPVEFQELMEYIAAHWIAADKNDVQKAQEMLAMAQAMGVALIDATQKEKTQTAKMRGRIVPRLDTFVRGRRQVVQEVD